MIFPPGSFCFSHSTYFLLTDSDWQAHSLVSDNSPLMQNEDNPAVAMEVWKYVCFSSILDVSTENILL